MKTINHTIAQDGEIGLKYQTLTGLEKQPDKTVFSSSNNDYKLLQNSSKLKTHVLENSCDQQIFFMCNRRV